MRPLKRLAIAAGAAGAAIALSGCNVSLDNIQHIPQLHSQSYQDCYSAVHSRKDNFNDNRRKEARDAIASGFWTRERFWNVVERKMNPQPDSMSDWVQGCAAAMHDDLGT